MRRIAFLAAAILLHSAAAAQESGRAFMPEDWFRLTTLRSPAVSPDGQLVAFTVTTVKEAENTRHSEVWVVPTAGGEPMRYTSPSTESSNPRWSHDGKYLFFSSQRAGGRGSTWALRMDRPGGEAFQMDDYPNGSMPEDGRFAVFTAAADGRAGGGQGGRGGGPAAQDPPGGSRADDPYSTMPATARPPFESVTRPVDPKRFDGRHIVDFPYKSNGRGFIPNAREARPSRPSQLWTQPVGDTARTRITDTDYSHGGAIVSPDGRFIAFTAHPEMTPDSVRQAERDSISRLPYDAARDEADRNDSDIFIIPIDGGTPRQLTSAVGSERSIAWAPDGRRLAWIASPRRTSSSRLWVANVAGGEPQNLLGDWQYEPSGFRWLSNGTILMNASIGGRTALFSIDTGTGNMTEVIGGRRRISGFSYDRDMTKVAFIATSVSRPTELFIADTDGGNERRLTGFNDALIEEIAFPDAERFTYTSVGGLEIEAWLQKPHGYEPGKQYPLVLYIHGGPHSAYGEGWFDEFHNITGAGMWVLYSNPRGSSGYGAEFTYSTRGRWGMEDYEDLMKAVDIAAARPDVDSTRMGVTGGSYGGFMTAWVTTRTNRFKAAQADRMISNWFSWYGTSEAQGLTEFEFYGKPWDNWNLYEELSPIKYVANVRTPTLIVQSEEDHRTPMTDAEQWFMSLEKQGVPVEFLRYPRSTHDLSRTGEPWLLVDRLGRLRQWFGHWLMNDEAVTTTESG